MPVHETPDMIISLFQDMNEGHAFEQAPGDGEGQGNLVCCSPWGRKESDMIEQLNNISEHLKNN